jgi:hypothetical protein
MKLYSIDFPGATPRLIEDCNEIALGEEGRGRELKIIPITGTGPEARIKRIDGNFVIVRGEFPPDSKCIVVINSVGEYSRYVDYDIFDKINLEILTSGIKAFGAAGRVNFGPCSLVIISPGGEFRLNSKYYPIWYRWDGIKWFIENKAERDARLALEKFHLGEGEWL